MAKKHKKQDTSNIIAVNKRVGFDYQIITKYNAGMCLRGWEIKALRARKCSIKEAYVKIIKGEAFLLSANFNLQVHQQVDKIEEYRARKLLLTKKEIKNIIKYLEEKGYTCVPVNIHIERYLAKCSIAVVKGKKLYDKRRSIKEREWNIQKQRTLKNTKY